MELDVYCTEPHPARIGEIARQAQAAGFAGLWVTEAAHNPYIAAALAAEAADGLMIGTDVAIAFPRSPMVTAQAAWDLAALSGGRFILGLGTQVKAHLERRFSVSGERPAARIREYILALRAIFDAFAKRAPLRFEGEFHRFSLLTDFFDPGPIEVPDPPIYLAGVNERLGQVAGEVADGFCVHPLNSPKYLAEVLRPSIEEGAKKAGRDASAVSLVAPVFVVVGEPGPELDRQRQAIRLQIAFYGTTPSYGRVLEVHGHDDLGSRLGSLLRAGDQPGMAAAIDDELLDAFAVTASWDGLAEALISRFGGLADRIFPYHARGLDDPEVAARWREVAAAVSAA
ncbi:MAG TPA: TIGR03617 family F420-dependent LLM class oxidoreductase [Acidimicrobiia bacterium]|nr:TIGR03617 family F420-dependent LLM class oxidoreductase [Acidimicrobiia bacterium]